MKKRINLAEEIKKRENYNNLTPFPFYDREIIEDMKKIDMITKKDNYNNVPVTYCKTCLSIHIKDINNPTLGYCIPCGNTDLGTSNIHVWEDLYEEKYGEKFLTIKKE